MSSQAIYTATTQAVSAKAPLPRVLIGPFSSDPAESVSAVNRAFRQGLADRYGFFGLPSDRTRGGTRQSKLNATNGFYFIAQLVRWTSILARERPALAHYAVSSGWGMEKGLIFLALARRFGARTLAHLHSGGFPDHWRGLPNWRRNSASRQFSQLNGLVLASDWWREQIGQHVPLPPEKLFTVNNPVDEEFERAALAMPIERQQNIALALGVMGRPKGIFEILNAAKIVAGKTPFKFIIAGGEREPNIAQEVRDFVKQNALSETIEVRTTISNAEKLELFRNASVLLLPSYYENFPLVVLEAAAAGLAIVTTPVGAVPEFFTDNVSALFVKPRQAEDIARALQVVSNPAERLRLANTAREVFSTRLTRARIMDSLDQVYRRVLHR